AHTRAKLESAIHLTCMSLDCGRKQECPVETHADMGRTCKLHAGRTREANPGPQVSQLRVSISWVCGVISPASQIFQNVIMEILGDFTYKEDLQKIENIFNEGGGSLNMNQFRQAVKSIREDMGNDEIDMLFMKLDVNCDGTVDWHKYLDYMVQEYRERECLEKYIQSHYFPKPMEVV
uniref:EF-hand domain-containing protein n=1 Tax=Erpetoichthys calabaricus TaxID=27687 RepID=A0A8C4X3Y2_ERPCA